MIRMAHFTVTTDFGTGTYQGDDSEDAVTLHLRAHDDKATAVVDVRPATVREALTAEYGEDWFVEDYRNAGSMSHVFNVYTHEGYSALHDPCIVLNHTMGRDVHGYADAIDVANYRVLREAWSELEGLSNGPYSGSSHIALDLDSEAPEDLIETIESLSDYPLLDEGVWSEVEQEMIQEHWDSYGLWDATGAIEKALGTDDYSPATLTDAAKDIIGQLVWDGILDYGAGGGYPTMVDVSWCDFGTDDVVKFFVDNRGQVVKGKSQNGYGNEYEFDLTDANIIEP